jgi:flagellar biosynthetic protein FlhB
MFADIGDLPQRILGLCGRIISAVLVATLVVAGADLAWARIHWRRDQRMSRQEVKEEVRQSEGDRLMRARLRSLRLDRSRKRMLTAVPRATMVVVNPTHYAVALRYVRSEGGAPLVIAKGVDLIALKIREIAEENSIPIIEDKPLARSLYDVVVVDSFIPPEFYRAVAELVHLIQEKRSSWPLTRNRISS